MGGVGAARGWLRCASYGTKRKATKGNALQRLFGPLGYGYRLAGEDYYVPSATPNQFHCLPAEFSENKHLDKWIQRNKTKQVKFIRSYGLGETVEIAGRSVGIVGRSNVGKSSLINGLCRQPIAKSSRTPGRTQLANVFQCGSLHLVDLPGYGYAQAPSQVRKGFKKIIRSASMQMDVVIVLLDSALGVTDLDVDMIHFLTSSRLKYIPVLTKADQCNVSSLPSLLSQVIHHPVHSSNCLFPPIITSHKLDYGIDGLWLRLAHPT